MFICKILYIFVFWIIVFNFYVDVIWFWECLVCGCCYGDWKLLMMVMFDGFVG